MQFLPPLPSFPLSLSLCLHGKQIPFFSSLTRDETKTCLTCSKSQAWRPAVQGAEWRKPWNYVRRTVTDDHPSKPAGHRPVSTQPGYETIQEFLDHTTTPSSDYLTWPNQHLIRMWTKKKRHGRQSSLTWVCLAWHVDQYNQITTDCISLTTVWKRTKDLWDRPW